MRSYLKLLGALVLSVTVLMALAINLATAQEQDHDYAAIELDQEQLDQMLAPIALYPDTLLSHILVASTYPLEVVEANRWRQSNKGLTEDMAREAVADMEWDPSVKALVPFTDLLSQMSEDLGWLQGLGDAFLANEEQVLASIQYLRQKAYDNGHLEDNEYVNVEQEDNQIIIETVRKEVVYVPYYDTRVVYGPWWHVRLPFYWHHPAHFVWHAGFYWSPRVIISPRFYFGGFHWRHRYVVINHHYPRTWHSHSAHSRHYRRVYTREYQRWQHNAVHRRGVRYTYASHPRVTTQIVRSRETGGGQQVVRHSIPHQRVMTQTQRHTARNVQQQLQQPRQVRRVESQPVDRRSQNRGTVHSGHNRRTDVQPRQLNRAAGNTNPAGNTPRQVQRRDVQPPSTDRSAQRSMTRERDRAQVRPQTPTQVRQAPPAQVRQAPPTQVRRAPPAQVRTPAPVQQMRTPSHNRNNRSSTSVQRSPKSSRPQSNGPREKRH